MITVKSLYKKVKTLAREVTKVINAHPIITALVVVAVYFLLLQLQFLINGDIWAEAYMEYLPKAIRSGWEMVTAPSWEGYVTLLPSFFTTSFLSLHGPLGSVDVYFRIVTILFTAVSLVVLASKFTATLWPRLWQRLVVIVFLLLLLGHVSAFSFINIWYIGFVPIIVVALAAVRMNLWQQALYTIFGVAVAFTKPSILLVPFVVYRAIKTKEYISNGLVLVAAAVQTYLLFFATSNGERHIAANVFGVIKVMYLGVGTELLKFLHIAPNDLLVLVANLVLVALFCLLVWRRGIIVTALVGFALLFAVYSYVLPPDPSLGAYTTTPLEIFANIYKLQREILIGVFLVLPAALLLPDAWATLHTWVKSGVLRLALGAGVIVLIGLAVYRPIDAKSGSVALDITPFRSSLTQGNPACMPVAPLPSWSPGTNWYFQYKGGCEFVTLPRAPEPQEMTEPVNSKTFVAMPGKSQYNLMSVVVPVWVPAPHHRQVFHLTDNRTGMTFSGAVLSSPQNSVQFVAFNVHGLAEQPAYHFTLTSEGPAFVSGDQQLRSYGYFMLFAP